MAAALGSDQGSPPDPALKASPTCFDRCFLLGKANRQGELDGAQQSAVAARLLARFLRADLAGIETALGDPTADERW